MGRHSGRRPGKPDTKGAILEAARSVFAEHGYDGASIRAIAERAGVDPALVHHYFGTKEELFREVVDLPIEPDKILPALVEGDVDQLGARLVDGFLSIWEGPVTGPAIETMLRSAFRNAMSERLVREFFTTGVLRRAMKELDGIINPDEAAIRASLVASQLFGLATARYILKIEPLASAKRDQIVDSVGPTLQRYLMGDISGG